MDLKKIAYTLSLFTLFISSCSKQDRINNKVIQVDISTSQPLNMADIVNHISIIPLETNDSCLIKRIVSMQVQNGKIFINNRRWGTPPPSRSGSLPLHLPQPGAPLVRCRPPDTQASGPGFQWLHRSRQ